MRLPVVASVTYVLLVYAVAAAMQSQLLVFSRPTFVAAPCESAPKWHVKVYDDSDYVFVYRHYGRAEYAPGFFVQNKSLNKWIEIKKLSTQNAKLGRSPSPEEIRLSVGWDYSLFSKMEYVELPLRTSGSINFPDKIVYDPNSQGYELDFNSSLKRDESLTRFWVTKSDIEEAFKRLR